MRIDSRGGLVVTRQGNKVVASMPVPDGVKITEDTLPGILAAGVQHIGRRVYVYEDAWNGTLIIATQRRRKEIGIDLLLTLWPSKRPRRRRQATPDSP